MSHNGRARGEGMINCGGNKKTNRTIFFLFNGNRYVAAAVVFAVGSRWRDAIAAC